MRFETPMKPGEFVSIKYDGIQWEEKEGVEFLHRTGHEGSVLGEVKAVYPPEGCVDEAVHVVGSHGEYKVFANGDVFALPDRFVGIDATVTVDTRDKVVA